MLYAQALRETIGTDAEQTIRNSIESFVSKDKEVESFLKNKAFEFEKRDKTRTYLVIDDESEKLMAFFALSLKSLDFRDTVSKSKIKDIDGFSKDVKGVAIVLICQFGKDEIKAAAVPGKDLLDICIDILYQIHALVGGRYVLLECRETEKVVGFYANSGFEVLQLDTSDGYLQMVRRL